MKNFLITVIILISFSASADFVCLKDKVGLAFLVAGSQYFQTRSIEECQEAINASKNGFTCLKSYSGRAYLITKGSVNFQAESVEECQKSVNESK
ncbi:MAG: hypothetical protein QE271_11920 [Bacteriovoracaceae bacterium]|nr:hypothetical protein [Bacteriovoracaceae bacterium]